MAVNCPQCGSAMSELDATQARCARHGAYTILFKRAAEDGLIPLAESSLPPASTDAAASYARQYIPYAQTAAPPAAMGPCQNHQQVAAVQRCSKCSARICQTCDFVFPGDLHLCPRCVTSGSGMSGGRRNLMIASFVMAGIATLTLALLIMGFATQSLGPGNQGLLGIIMLMVISFSVAGMGMGIGTINRNLSNPVGLWIASIWNALLAGAMILLIVIGIMRSA